MSHAIGPRPSAFFAPDLSLLGTVNPSPKPFHGTTALTGHRVYNFEVETHHTYIAGGIRVHNRSVLDFLSDEQIKMVNFDSLADTNNDNNYDYVELDNNLGGLNAVGGTAYKIETINGATVTRVFITKANEQGQLVQVQFVQGEGGVINPASFKTVPLQGAVIGQGIGTIVTPFLAAALLGDDASLFERLAVDTLLGTFVENLFEFAGGAIHDQLASGGLQNNTFDDVAAITFGDFGQELSGAAINGASGHLVNWVMAELFANMQADTPPEAVLQALARHGLNYLVDVSVHSIAVDVLGMTAEEAAKWGAGLPKGSDVFGKASITNLLVSTLLDQVLPDVETVQGAVGSQVISLVLQALEIAGPVVGFLLGRIGGLILDWLFDKDPSAYSSVTFDAAANRFVILDVDVDDGGNSGLARSMALRFNDFVNGVLEASQATAHNVGTLAANNRYRFGHDEEDFRNGDGRNYDSVEEALSARMVDVMAGLSLHDGDAKIAKAISGAMAKRATLSATELLSEISVRMQVAQDYQAYLENKSHYDALIASDSETVFSQSWVMTFAAAVEYGLNANFTRTGTAGHNTFLMSSGNDSVLGNGGNDTVHGYSGNDTVYGGEGHDVIYGGEGRDALNGDAGNDTLYGGAGADMLYGGAGDDVFYASQAARHTNGATAQVGPVARLGNDSIYGGVGRDLIRFDGAIAEYAIVDKGGNVVEVTRRASGDRVTLSSVEFLHFKDQVRTFDPAYKVIIGTIGDDLLRGSSVADAIYGDAGDDVLYGFDGNDLLTGDDGDDTIFGGRGDDWVFGMRGSDVIYGGAGNDVTNGGAHDDYVWGRAGNDTVKGEGGDDVLAGEAGNDSLEGGNGDDVIDGGTGNDRIFGGTGDDDIYGGIGADHIEGREGDDAIDGGVGNDTILAGLDDDWVSAGDGHDSVLGESGDDTLHGRAGNDTIFGGWGDDVVYGGDGDDKIFALRSALAATPFTFNRDLEQDVAINHYSDWGSELVYAGNGNDQVAVSGTDIVFGGAGDDVFYASDVQFRINGGSGTDKIIFEKTDAIDAIWYTTAAGRIGAAIWTNDNDGRHETATSVSYVTGVEIIQAENGRQLTFGQTWFPLKPGYGRADKSRPTIIGGRDDDRPTPPSNINVLTDAAFDKLFSEAAFLDRRNKLSTSTKLDAPAATGPEQLGAGNDIITNTDTNRSLSGVQHILAGAGNDRIDAGPGNDRLNGQSGNDVLNGFSGNDVLIGDVGNDTLSGNSGEDSLYGGDGVDSLLGGAGDDYMSGGEGSDVLHGESGHDQLFGLGGNDHLFGGTGRDTLKGGVGNDSLTGGDSPDQMFGEDGNDTLRGDAGSDVMYGGNGQDLMTGGIDGDILYGGEHNDTLHGDASHDNLYGGEGDDDLYGGTGSDSLFGGNGDDSLDGGDSADVLSGGVGNDKLTGGAGNDRLLGSLGDDVLIGGAGSDYLDGGVGSDTVRYDHSAAAVRVDLERQLASGGDAHHDRLISIENLIGSALGDILTGNSTGNFINGLGGNDQLNGQAGLDTIHGGDGNDTIYGGTGNDVLHGNAGLNRLYGDDGNDTLYGGEGAGRLYGGLGADVLVGGAANDALYGGLGNDAMTGGLGLDTLEGGAGDDTLRGNEGHDVLRGGDGNDQLLAHAGDDFLAGGRGNDILYGDLGADELEGGEGNDVLHGQDGNDILTGGHGADKLYGGNGRDIIDGGSGNDVLSGGAGPDVFLFGNNGGADRITDFVRGLDKIALLEGQQRVFIHSQSATEARLVLNDGSSVYLQGIAAELVRATDFIPAEGKRLELFLVQKGTTDHEALTGTAHGDALYGLGGNDTLRGGNGDDFIDAGTGADWISGGPGADEIYLGNDRVRDTVAYQALEKVTAGRADVLHQFNAEHDLLDLRVLDANAALAGDQAFKFSGSSAAVNSVWFVRTATGLQVRADANGDATVDLQININNVFSLSADNFLL